MTGTALAELDKAPLGDLPDGPLDRLVWRVRPATMPPAPRMAFGSAI